MISTDISLEELNSMSKDTMGDNLGIVFTGISKDTLIATMPVDKRTIQPLGLLHGGASVTLAETLGSVAAYLSVDSAKYYPVGVEINANHVRSVKTGKVTGTATAIHIGRSTHVWDIKIVDKADKLVCTSRITLAIIEKN